MNIMRGLKNFFFIALLFALFPLLQIIMKHTSKLFDRYIDTRSQIGLITITGLLYDSHSYTKQLCAFFEDDYIKGILIKIECPGGASGTGQAIFNELRTFKKQYPQKPVVTLVENICTSAGYYIAAGSDHIVAPPSALVGSIGARFGYLFQLSELLAQYKIHYKSVKAGTYKNITDPFVDMSDQERSLLQAVVDDTYHQFIEDVAHQRKLSIAQAPDWADGKLFTARQGHKLGLIDTLGSLSDAKRILKEKALIEGDIKFISLAKKKGLFGFFSSSGEEIDKSNCSSFIKNLCSTLENRYMFSRMQ